MVLRNSLQGMKPDLDRSTNRGVVFCVRSPNYDVTSRLGKPVLAVMPWELYETITETLEVMADEELTSVLKESIAPVSYTHLTLPTILLV